MPTSITQLELTQEHEIERSNAKHKSATKRIPRATLADAKAQLLAQYAQLFASYGRYAGYSRDAKLHTVASEHSDNAPSPQWIKTQNLVRNRTKRINGATFQRSTRWCANLDQRADKLDKFDTVRLFQHGAKRGR